MRKTIVLYDGWCPFCIKSINRFKQLDWFKRIEFKSFREESIVNKYHIEIDKLEKRIHSITKNNYIEDGIHAINRICKNIPALWFLILFINFSILFGFGQKLYDWIADRRLLFPTGCNGDSCTIPNISKIKDKEL
ncbi:uncharacterized protein SSIL_3724 [Solibacillus silvestris StLB046]|uniref:DUF393 domain-containing protein n=1 Tax=Solibacillus silvestris (strain StLB046) TaxID=1002809 RepID=F2F571_SOLSS|nr:DUF393 domain-containing protein [Solibacillus silvestris]BAK18147.1 uncharacterized protein SSIL_3724 [Solibacillus silvestris StLB046]